MSYTKHADNILLSATPNASLEAFRLDSGTPVLGVCIFYTANVASSTGYPAFRLYWTVPGVGEVLATVRNTTPAISAGEASLSEYDGIVLCKDRIYDCHKQIIFAIQGKLFGLLEQLVEGHTLYLLL